MVTTVMSDWRAPAAQVEIDPAKVRAAIPRVVGQVNELVRSIPDVAMPVPGSAWVCDTAAHLVVVFRGFTDAMEGRLEYWDARYGEGDIRTSARLEGNARTLREVAEATTPALWPARGPRACSAVLDASPVRRAWSAPTWPSRWPSPS